MCNLKTNLFFDETLCVTGWLKLALNILYVDSWLQATITIQTSFPSLTAPIPRQNGTLNLTFQQQMTDATYRINLFQGDFPNVLLDAVILSHIGMTKIRIKHEKYQDCDNKTFLKNKGSCQANSAAISRFLSWWLWQSIVSYVAVRYITLCSPYHTD